MQLSDFTRPGRQGAGRWGDWKLDEMHISEANMFLMHLKHVTFEFSLDSASRDGVKELGVLRACALPSQKYTLFQHVSNVLETCCFDNFTYSAAFL